MNQSTLRVSHMVVSLLQLEGPAPGSKVDSKEKADSLVLDLNGKVEKLRFCVGSSQNLLQHPLPANARLAPELANSVMTLIEEIQRMFIQIQAFEGFHSLRNGLISHRKTFLTGWKDT